MEYFVGKNGRQVGPLSEADVRARMASGEFNGADLVWRQGMASWESLDRMFGNPYQPSAALGDSPLLRNGPGLYPLAHPLTRLGAKLLNALLFVVAMIPLIIGVGLLEEKSAEFYDDSAGGGKTPLVGTIVTALGGLVLLAFVVWQLVMLSKAGQSLGKRILKIRIVTFEGDRNPGFVPVVLMRGAVPWMISCVPGLGALFSLINACFVFREDRRCIHDLMANTKVVQA